MAANPILEALKARIADGAGEPVDAEQFYTQIILKSGKDLDEVLAWGFNVDETAVEVREADLRTQSELMSERVRTVLDKLPSRKALQRRGVILISEIAAVLGGYEG